MGGPSRGMHASFLVPESASLDRQQNNHSMMMTLPHQRIPATAQFRQGAGAMDQLVARVKRVGGMRALSDPLLLALLSHSDPRPDRVADGVVLFSEGERSGYWYLLLSGEVQLYLPANPYSGHGGQHLRSLGAGALFGELNGGQGGRHCCSARVRRPAEFVRINQAHFLSLYNKHADHLQPFLTVMSDLLSDETGFDPSSSGLNGDYRNAPRATNAFDFVSLRQRCDEMVDTLPPQLPPHVQQQLPADAEGNLFELSNTISFEERIIEVGLLLKHAMLSRTPMLIRDRPMHGKMFTSSMIGSEMVDWLYELASESIAVGAAPPTRFQLTGMWQALLEHNVVSHVTNEQQFMDKHVLYRWTVVDSQEHVQRSLDRHPNMKSMPGGGLIALDRHPVMGLVEPPSPSELASAIFFLSTAGPDALFRMILGKPPEERTAEELELVYEELLHVKALAHLSTMVKRELAMVIGFQQHKHSGTVLFHQGDPGRCWYIILKGAVDVSIHGKGVVCTLQEGDDFGKLALVNDSPRAATISLREPNAQFLIVDKHDFNRILRDVEANTVRLKEHGQDVLVLEKISLPIQPVSVGIPNGSAHSPLPIPSTSTAKTQCCYSVMAGLPEKMLEYVLETRVDAQAEDSTVPLDTFLEDFLLTHCIYLPTNELCNLLKNYYMRRVTLIDETGRVVVGGVESPFEMEQRIAAKRRVVTFVRLWVHTLGVHFFLDAAANSFIEELYCCVLDDHKRMPNMDKVLAKMTAIRELKEAAKRVLARHPSTVLECSVYSSNAPAPNPILPSDTCNQIVHLSDTTYFTLAIRTDKTAAEICEMARARVRYSSSKEPLQLVEVKSNGEKRLFAPTEISIPTLIGLNSKLYVVYKDEIDLLMPQPDQRGPSESVHASVMEYLSSQELAQQLALFHAQLLEATDESELIIQVIGRDQFPGRVPSNLDILMRRFNEVQFWTTTEVLLAPGPSKRLNMLKKFIKIAQYAKENRDLMSFFAITLGLSNIAVSRLTLLWEKLPSKMRRQFGEFECLLDPSRNHRAYRILVDKLNPPLVPFVPLLLKDLTFTHEGNKSYFSGLVNFEKMHMIANVLRSFRQCKSSMPINMFEQRKIYETQSLIRNFRVIDSQRRLMDISYQIEPQRRKRFPN